MKVDIDKYRNIPFTRRTCCVVCGSKLGQPVIDLPDFPMTEIYSDTKVKEKIGFVDQAFHFCENCGHGQIANVIDIELQYGETFSYHFRTSESASARKSADFFVEFLNKTVEGKHFKNIIELGCSDLYLLKKIREKGEKLIGIDPVLKGTEEEFSEGNVLAIGDFFENVNLKEEIDLVICKDTLEHVSEPRQFMKKIVERGHKETIFLFQFPLLETLLESSRFDQVFHQHLNYFSLQSIIYLLDSLGCELMDYTIDVDHWGAILIAFKKGKTNSKFSKKFRKISVSEIKNKYNLFRNNIELTNKQLSLLRGKRVYGYGAALMLPVLSYHLGSDLSGLRCIIDDDKRKEGLFYINLPVSIKSRESVKDLKESIVLITAIASKNNVRWILNKLFEINPKQIILPINIL
jgi:hypothetical protein